MTHLGLFAGIGGFELAARWAGWQTVAVCEWDKYGKLIRWIQDDCQPKSGLTTQNIPDWREFPTQPPVCSRNDGVSPGLVGITVSRHRRESLKAYGNAIVPQVALQIFKAINEYENTSNTNKY